MNDFQTDRRSLLKAIAAGLLLPGSALAKAVPPTAPPPIWTNHALVDGERITFGRMEKIDWHEVRLASQGIVGTIIANPGTYWGFSSFGLPEQTALIEAVAVESGEKKGWFGIRITIRLGAIYYFEPGACPYNGIILPDPLRMSEVQHSKIIPGRDLTAAYR